MTAVCRTKAPSAHQLKRIPFLTQRNSKDAQKALERNPHLMLIAQVCLQITQLGAVEIAQPTLVGFDVIVPHHVQTQVFWAATGESTFVTAEDDALKVT